MSDLYWLTHEGVAKMLNDRCASLQVAGSRGHSYGVIRPLAEGIGTGLAAAGGGEFVAMGMKDQVDLAMGGEEPLRLAGRLEAYENLPLLAARASMAKCLQQIQCT